MKIINFMIPFIPTAALVGLRAADILEELGTGVEGPGSQCRGLLWQKVTFEPLKSHDEFGFTSRLL